MSILHIVLSVILPLVHSNSPKYYVVEVRSLHQPCSGTIVTDRWVLTAGSCVYRSLLPKSVNVVAYKPKSVIGELMAVLKIVMHPRFEASTTGNIFDNNVALLKLAKRISVKQMINNLDLDYTPRNRFINTRLTGKHSLKIDTTSPNNCDSQEKLKFVCTTSVVLVKSESTMSFCLGAPVILEDHQVGMVIDANLTSFEVLYLPSLKEFLHEVLGKSHKRYFPTIPPLRRPR